MKATWPTAIHATVHCLIGCGIGEITGMVIGTFLGWSNAATMLLAIGLAFLFGYSLTFGSLLRHQVPPRQAVRITLAVDTLSIATMELIDNVLLLLIPGAMHAHITDGLFWASLLLALFVAFWVTVPVNYLLIARGLGHAKLHGHGAHHYAASATINTEPSQHHH